MLLLCDGRAGKVQPSELPSPYVWSSDRRYVTAHLYMKNVHEVQNELSPQVNEFHHVHGPARLAARVVDIVQREKNDGDQRKSTLDQQHLSS